MLKHQFILANKNIEKEKITLWMKSSNIIKKIDIEDEFIQKISKKLDNIKTIWITSDTNRKVKNNLNYYGITIIPDESIETFLDIIKKSENDNILNTMMNLLKEKKENNILIHLGI